jgi:hypothetical protein
MKKVIFTIVALFILCISTTSAQAVWGARVGVSKPMVSFDFGDGDKESLDGRFGVELGPVLYYSLKKNFYLNTALMFSIKTFKEEGTEYDGYSYTSKMTSYWIDVPIYAGYAFDLGKVNPYIQLGPYMGFKLAEKWSYSDNEGTNESGSDDAAFSSFNAGLALMAGVNIKRFKIEIGYQLGLANVASKEWKDWGAKTKLNSLFLGVNFVF